MKNEEFTARMPHHEFPGVIVFMCFVSIFSVFLSYRAGTEVKTYGLHLYSALAVLATIVVTYITTRNRFYFKDDVVVIISKMGFQDLRIGPKFIVWQEVSWVSIRDHDASKIRISLKKKDLYFNPPFFGSGSSFDKFNKHVTMRSSGLNCAPETPFKMIEKFAPELIDANIDKDKGIPETWMGV